MKLTICLIACVVQSARATLPVVDYSHIAEDAAHQVVNVAHYAQTELNTLNTELNTLHTYENTILEVTRMGNPAALQNIPVIGSIAQLAGSGPQLLQQYQQIRAMANPQYLQSGLNSMQNAYQLQRWNPMAPGAYQFPTASYNVSQTVQDQMAKLEQQRQTLEQQRDATLRLLQGATTQAEVSKYSGALAGVNGALNEIAARANELAQRSQLQQQQLNAGAAVQRQQVTETTAAGFGADVNTSLNALKTLSDGFGQPPQGRVP
jgi:hypothetical protein